MTNSIICFLVFNKTAGLVATFNNTSVCASLNMHVLGRNKKILDLYTQQHLQTKGSTSYSASSD